MEVVSDDCLFILMYAIAVTKIYAVVINFTVYWI